MTGSVRRRLVRLVVTGICAALPLGALFVGCNNFWHDLILLPEKTEVTAPEKSAPVNAAVPQIDTQPQGRDYRYNETVQGLTVGASVGDGGQLTYRWYSNTTDSNTGGTAIDGASGAAYTPAGLIVETPVYYYVVVTNTIADNGDGGIKSTSATSGTARILVSDRVNAAVPQINTQPQGKNYLYNETVQDLTVSASASDGGQLTYRWYSNIVDNNTSGTEAGTGVSNTPAGLTTGTAVYYYVEVTNTITDNGDGGTKSASTTSNTAKLTRLEQQNAGTPSFSVQPSGGGVYLWNSSVTLTVTAAGTVSGGSQGTLTIRWYYNTTDSNASGTDAGTGAPFAPSTAAAGDRWYYAVVTNTIADNGDGGTKSASATSNTVKVGVYSITGVTVTPSYAEVGRDQWKDFTAVVNGDNYPPQGVTWSISGQTKQGTTIGENSGRLTVAEDEKGSLDITVKATSTADSSIYGMAAVITDIDFKGEPGDWENGGTGTGTAE